MKSSSQRRTIVLLPAAKVDTLSVDLCRPATYIRLARARSLCLVGVWLFLFASHGVQAAETRPNILFLLADDQRADTLAAWGNDHIKTPTLDRLVAQGFSFRNNYCLGANSGAVCVPSRAMLNSGRPYFRINNNLKNVPILPELLRANGYTTFGTGKWHNGGESFLQGFEKGHSVFLGGMSDHLKVPLRDVSDDGRFVNLRLGTRQSSEIFADAAIDFLREQDGSRPYYAYVAFTAPHDPRQPPEEYRQLYYDALPPLPANFLPQHPFDNGHLIIRDENLAAWPRTPEVIRDQLAEYYGLITHLDEQIGRILQTLQETGQADNTVIVYAADHGLAMGSHGLLGKQNVYEHSMKCPLIFAGPGIPAGRGSDALTYLLDIYPTICGLTNTESLADPVAEDLQPIWSGRQQKVRDTLFLSFQRDMRAVRDDRWKLIRYPRIDHTQLFDLEQDPEELHNLAQERLQAERVEHMLSLIEAWQKDLGDKQDLFVDEPLSKEIDLTGRERDPDQHQPDWIVEKYFEDAAK